MNRESLQTAREHLLTLDPYGMLEINEYLMPETKNIEGCEYPSDMFDDLDVFYDEYRLRRYLIGKHISFDETRTMIASNPTVFKTKGGIMIYPSANYNLSSIKFQVNLMNVEILGGSNFVRVFKETEPITYEEINLDMRATTSSIREALNSLDRLDVIFRFVGTNERFVSEQPSSNTFVFDHFSMLGYSRYGPSLVPDRQTALKMIKTSLLAQIFL
jgi:hypothetical protein